MQCLWRNMAVGYNTQLWYCVGVIPNCGMTQLYCLSWSSTDWRDLACPPPIWPTATCMLPSFNNFLYFFWLLFLATLDGWGWLYHCWLLTILNYYVTTESYSFWWVEDLTWPPHACQTSWQGHCLFPINAGHHMSPTPTYHSLVLSIYNPNPKHCQRHNGQILSTLEHIRWQSAHPIILLLVHVDIASVNMY